MAKPVLFERSKAAFEAYGESDGQGCARIARLIGPEISASMGAGLASFDNISVRWTVLYDEVIVGIEGQFRLRLTDQLHVVGPGDVLWIPSGTELCYEGTQALIFYALYPVDWRSRPAGAA